MDTASRLVAVALPPGSQFLGVLARARDSGAAILPIDPDLPATVREGMLLALRPHVLITAAGVAPLPDGVEVEPGVGVVIATSGSTGAPKGVELTHAALDASADATIARLGLGPDDPWLCCLPVNHIAGLQTLLRAQRAGADVVIHPHFDVHAVARAAAAVVSLVPTQLVRLLDAGVDLRRFRWILLGGAPAAPDLLHRAAEAGARTVTTYGMTETCGGCVYDGRPLTGMEAAVGGDGRIRLRGAMRFRGYRLDQARTASVIDSDGWFVTDDLGTFRHGRLVVSGRADDVIVTGGEKVPAGKVARLLADHPQIAEAEVVPRPDPEWGQRVVAVIVPTGSGAPSLAAVRAWLADWAPRSHAPLELEVITSLPRLASGKVDRQALIRGKG